MISHFHFQPCDICKEVSSSQKSQESHLLQHPSCTVCPNRRRFLNNDTLQLHLKQTHTVLCPDSNCKFSCLANKVGLFDDHVKWAHGKRCYLCDSYSYSASEYQAHLDRAHRFRCDFCEMTCVDRSELEAHMTCDHSYKCRHCSLLFSSPRRLLDHLLESHSFPSSQCDSSHPTMSELGKHVTASHYHPCRWCDLLLNYI